MEDKQEETFTFVGEPMSVRELGEMLLRGMKELAIKEPTIKEGDLVEVTATAKVLSVTGDRCLLQLHGETVPFLISQCKLIPPPPKESEQ